MTTTSGKLHVLLLSGSESECAISLQQALAPHVEFTTARSLAECLCQIEREGCSAGRAAEVPAARLREQKGSGFDAFLCEWCYQGGTWKEAVESVHRQAPELPVIVVCRTGGEEEWVEVLQAGGVDLITAPFSEEEVLAALQRAVASPAEHALMKTT
jgi:DNA-binding NtrC family response regulator